MSRALACLALSSCVLAACGSGATATSAGDDGVGGSGGLGLDASSSGGDFSACASATVTASRAPADLYVMLDYSESMGTPAGTADRWTAVTSALRAFFSSPDSAGLGVGVQYFGLFPPLVGWSAGSSCDPRDYASPDVEIAPLPGAAAALDSSLDAHAFPRTATPMAPALQGALDHARAWALAHPSHAVAVLLATDGEPTECAPQSVGEIASKIVAPAARAKPPVRTFVVGVGDLGALDALAAAGGTGQAHLATGANVEAELLAALDSIRASAIPCAFELPVPASGTLDPTLVNVTYTQGGAGKPRTLPEVLDASRCGTAFDWYYDDALAPTRIELCPAACAAIEGDATGVVEVVLGCDSVRAPTR